MLINQSKTTGIKLIYDGSSLVTVAHGVSVISNQWDVPALLGDTYAWSVTNNGTLYGETAVRLNAGGTVTNNGKISSDCNDGVLIKGASGKVVNYGTILNASVAMANSTGALTAAVTNAGMISNLGTIIGHGGVQDGAAVDLSASQLQASINNSGTILGNAKGIYISATSATTNLVNSGRIADWSSPFAAVYERATAILKATLTNTGTGIISNNGILSDQGTSIRLEATTSLTATITNQGTITANTWIAEDMSSLYGAGKATVTNYGSMHGLHVAGVKATLNNYGTITGNSSALQVDKDATLSVQSAVGSRITGPVIDNGTIKLSDKTMLGHVTGTGMLFINPNSTVGIGDTTASKISFTGTNETLKLQTPGTSSIVGFGSGDTVDLLGDLVFMAKYYAGASHSGSLVLTSAHGSVGLQFAGDYTLKNFALSSDLNGGTNITWHA